MRDCSGQWRWASWVLLLLLLGIRWIYVAGNTIELSEDEAYQWLWSKYLDWSYYSKPPLIAWTHWLGTGLFGDTSFGVRWFSPLFAFLTGLGLRRFVARFSDDRTAFLFLLVVTASPVLAVGSTLMTVDALNVFFWMLTLVTSWEALRTGRRLYWVLAGVGMAGCQLSKFFLPFHLLSFGVFFLLSSSARRVLRGAGPWLALSIGMLGWLPPWIWNVQHDWVTLQHLSERAGMHHSWRPTFRFIPDFAGVTPLLLNPVFFVLSLAAVFRYRHLLIPSDSSDKSIATDAASPPMPSRVLPLTVGPNELPHFLFSMAIPVMLIYLLHAFGSRVHPNWVATSFLPFLMLGTWYWHRRWKQGARSIKKWWVTGLALGLPVVILMHDTSLVGALTGSPLPGHLDPLRRVRGHQALAKEVVAARNALLEEGQPVFVIADHYGRASLLNFYLEEAREALPQDRFIYVLASDAPTSQYALWPGYETRTGQNAVYVQRVRKGISYGIPTSLQETFESIETLGIADLYVGGVQLHQVELMFCRNKL